MSDELRNKIREIIKEELENMFSVDSDGDDIPDTEEMSDSLESEIDRQEDEINQRKKTVNISQEVDPQLATKEKMLKKQQLDQAEERLKNDEDNLEMIQQLGKGIEDYRNSLEQNVDAGIDTDEL